jgi:hypothetical protein
VFDRGRRVLIVPLVPADKRGRLIHGGGARAPISLGKASRSPTLLPVYTAHHAADPRPGEGSGPGAGNQRIVLETLAEEVRKDLGAK